MAPSPGDTAVNKTELMCSRKGDGAVQAWVMFSHCLVFQDGSSFVQWAPDGSSLLTKVPT